MADMTYIKLFVDYLDAIEPLGDAERGRLFTSLLEYARTGEAPQLGGNERFLFPMMRAQIDRDNAAMTGLSEARSKAGKIGAEAKQANSGFNYVNVTKTTTHWGSSEWNTKITKSGSVQWTDNVFEVARENNAYSCVTLPNSNKIYTIEEYMQMFLMN